jgi:hypothetical protein
MHPMFLPEVENNPQPDSPYTALIRQALAGGHEYPKIWHVFAFRPHATQHLAQFTQEILRGEAPLSPGSASSSPHAQAAATTARFE